MARAVDLGRRLSTEESGWSSSSDDQPLAQSGGVLVAVVGSANVDLVATVERLPRPGETVLGTSYSEQLGGKGANQALGAARVTGTALIGSVGSDDAGARMLGHLASRQVDISHLTTVAAGTGRALIHVTPDGENSITVLPLANHELTADAVQRGLDALRPAVVICQCEIPAAAVDAAAAWALLTGARFVLNPSPVRELSRDLVAQCDPLIVNEAEAAAVLGMLAMPHDGALAAALAAVARSVVVTAGSRGATVAVGRTVTDISPVAVIPVDTTGAGDEFAGSLVGHLALGATLADAASRANERAAVHVATPRAER